MALDSTTKAIAKEAWSQLVRSIISDIPPSDMGPEYYYTFPEVGSDGLQKQLERLEIYKYKLGTESIRARMRSVMQSQVVRPNEDNNRQEKHSKVVQENDMKIRKGLSIFKIFSKLRMHSKVMQANEHENQQGIEHVRGSIRSNKHHEVVQANEDKDRQEIEHIQGCIRSNKNYSELVQTNEDMYQQDIEHIQGAIRSNKHSELVLAYEDENRQEIEHIRGCIRSNKHSELVQEYEDENRQGIEHIRDCIRSNKYSEVVQTNEDENQQGLPKPLHELEYAYQQLLNYAQAKKLSTLFDELLELVENNDLHGEEKLTLRFQVLKVIKLLHHYGIDTIRTGVEEELEDVNQKYDDIEKDLAMLYKKKGLEVMLRICDAEKCQRTIYEIIGKAERAQVLYKW